MYFYRIIVQIKDGMDARDTSCRITEQAVAVNSMNSCLRRHEEFMDIDWRRYEKIEA